MAKPNKYRIFTNDRRPFNGIPMYSCYGEVMATDKAAALRSCPTRFDAPNYAPAVAIPWPVRKQSEEDKAWLTKHVGKSPYIR